MGVEPYLLSGAVNGVVAQRLLRKVCPHCTESYYPEDHVLRSAHLDGDKPRKFTRGKGGGLCHGSGYQGRTGIYEVMEMTPGLRRLIQRGISPQQIREKWQEGGGLTLRQEAVRMALDGRTSLEEALAVTHSEGETVPDSSGPAPEAAPALAAAE